MVADSLKLGAGILSRLPDQLAAQLIGRLLPEVDTELTVEDLWVWCRCGSAGWWSGCCPSATCSPLRTPPSSPSPTASSRPAAQ